MTLCPCSSFLLTENKTKKNKYFNLYGLSKDVSFYFKSHNPLNIHSIKLQIKNFVLPKKSQTNSSILIKCKPTNDKKRNLIT